MNEREEAKVLANKLLDEPNADPDDDLRVFSRQLLRTHEALAKAVQVIEWKSLYTKAEMGWYAEALVAQIKGLPEPENAFHGMRWYEHVFGSSNDASCTGANPGVKPTSMGEK
jgi:hypothetical protein